MKQQDFFPLRPQATPKIYAYSSPSYPGLLKVGETKQDVATRVKQQFGVKQPIANPFTIELEEIAMRSDGTSFNDHDVHAWLRHNGIENPNGEWFKCNVDKVKAAIIAVRERSENIQERTWTFDMRPEQKKAVERTAEYFEEHSYKKDGKTPHFLWNCKMRFGKTFAAYQLARKMNWRKVLVLTFKPAVESAWEEDLKYHVDFENWQFISRATELDYEQANKDYPIVCFGSFQDYLGTDRQGRIKQHNEWVHAINWDCVIFDEYHYGAWDEKAKSLFASDEDLLPSEALESNQRKDYNEDLLLITSNAYLYLSGTPFRALQSGEFNEEQIFNWTYQDEQQAKASWELSKGPNPYASLPRMVLMTYQLPNELVQIAQQGEFDEFSLNAFFEAEGEGDEAQFKHKDEVQKWLNLIRGSYREHIVSDLKLRNNRPPMPFSHAPLLQTLTHTLWLFRTVSSCFAMRNLLKERQNTFYHDYKVIVAAGSNCGVGTNALTPVKKAMTNNPLETKTITLSCGKLTTGVTVRPWSGIFMLCNLSSPETYFQAAFRVQSPWVIRNSDGLSPNKEEILKQECYIFDFAPDRALKQIAHYSQELNVSDPNPEHKVAEFIHFLPVLAYDGFSMKQIDPAGILDIAMSGTSATLLARRWQSALLVNVDNETLKRLMDNEKAMNALMQIEGFRSLNNDIETIINKSNKLKKLKTKAKRKGLSQKEKNEKNKEEKEYKKRRKQIQEKLIKFATRIPIFMYLTDYREMCLRDVITKLEPSLFKKVTGLSIEDFELLVSLNVFNGSIMNDAVFRFKRYEDASLVYIGINKHADENIGLYDTVISASDYQEAFINTPLN